MLLLMSSKHHILLEELNLKNIKKLDDKKAIALYYCVGKATKFETAAFEIFEMVRAAQEKMPNKDRHLYIDIEGYLQQKHKYQQDMYELEMEFLIKMLFANNWIKELNTPLVKIKNPNKQVDEVPEKLQIEYEEQAAK